ncbi:MAG: FtsX-like permease family protein, partial [Promethearchaeota archaeon]
MGVIFRVAIRNMKRRKSRYILTTITLIIGVALFGGMLIVRDSFRVMFVKDIDNRMGTADILIRESETQDGWFRADDLEDIKDLSHIEQISYRIAGFYVYSSSTPNGTQLYNSTKTAVYGIDIDSDDEKEIGGELYIVDSAVEGDSIEELLDVGLNEYGINTIVITESLQIKLGKDFEAGNQIWILPINYHKVLGKPDKYEEELASNTGLWEKYTVAAIIRDLGEARDFKPETPSTFSSPSLGPCLFADIETTHNLVDGGVNHEGQYNLAAVGIDDVNNNKDVVAAIKDELGNNWRVADLKTDLINDINASVELIMTLFLIFALLSLILSLILILNIFNIIREELEYETGILQSIGASSSETFKVFLIQGVVMGIIGAIIGTICSYFMSYLIFYMTVESLKNIPGEFGEMFADTSGQIILYPYTIAITFAVGLISCILAAIYPSWKASRKPPIENLHLHARKLKREKRHHMRKIISFLLAIMVIVYGAYLIFGIRFNIPLQGTLNETTVSIIGPTLILLGLIGIAAIFAGPITCLFIKIFGPYLKQTKLLTKKNILRYRRRTVLTFSMISVTISYLVGVSVIMGSLREGVQTTVNNVMGCDIRIFTANTPRSFEEELKNIDGVDDVMGISHLSVQLWYEDKNEWIGHGLLDKDWDKSIKAHVLDTETITDHMNATRIFEPRDMTLEEMMDDLSEEKNSIIITENEASYFNLDVGDEILAKFSVGISYPNINDMINDYRGAANENFVTRNMEVIAIVEHFQGFASFGILGQPEDSYNIFISWETYEDIASYHLPGGNTDIIFREKPQSGEEDIDLNTANWFNFSEVYPILESISGIDYYTTRMDYFSPTYNPNLGFDYDNIIENLENINFKSSVVGIRTNSTKKFVDDSYFGEHTLIRKSAEYEGTTMEELLNTRAKVCVIGKTLFNIIRLEQPSFDIGSNLTIFPQLFNSNL